MNSVGSKISILSLILIVSLLIHFQYELDLTPVKPAPKQEIIIKKIYIHTPIQTDSLSLDKDSVNLKKANESISPKSYNKYTRLGRGLKKGLISIN